MSKQTKSELMKQRHIFARETRNFYRNITGEKGKYSDFMRDFDNGNPASDVVVGYKVQFSQNYNNLETGNKFIIEEENFIVYLPKYIGNKNLTPAFFVCP